LPGGDVGGGLRVTNDTTPTFGWEYDTTSPEFGWQEGTPVEITAKRCALYSNRGGSIQWMPCESPWLTDDEIWYRESGCTGDCSWPMPDGRYQLEVFATARQQSPFSEIEHAFRGTQIFEVDTVAPRFIVESPTGRRVVRGANEVVTFDEVFDSAKFVNIYKWGSSTPLAVSRQTTDGQIVLDPKNNLKGDTRYTVKVTTGVNDGANNLESPYRWSFKTR
jgi:Big-like domain-containing protein